MGSKAAQKERSCTEGGLGDTWGSKQKGEKERTLPF